MGKVDSASLDVAMNDVFGEEEQQVYTAENGQYSTPDYSHLPIVVIQH